MMHPSSAVIMSSTAHPPSSTVLKGFMVLLDAPTMKGVVGAEEENAEEELEGVDEVVLVEEEVVSCGCVTSSLVSLDHHSLRYIPGKDETNTKLVRVSMRVWTLKVSVKITLDEEIGDNHLPNFPV